MTPAAALLILQSYTVTDGGTLRAGGVGIRLRGIDAAEPDEPGGPEARAALRGSSALHGRLKVTAEERSLLGLQLLKHHLR